MCSLYILDVNLLSDTWFEKDKCLLVPLLGVLDLCLKAQASPEGLALFTGEFQNHQFFSFLLDIKATGAVLTVPPSDNFCLAYMHARPNH